MRFIVALCLFVVPTFSLAQERTPTPDLRVIDWEVIDAPDGNGDGALHPGETAQLRVPVHEKPAG